MNADFERQINNLPKKGNSLKDKFFNKDYFLRSSEYSISTIEKDVIEFNDKNSITYILMTVGFGCLFIIRLKMKESFLFYPMIIFVTIAIIANFIYLKTKKRKTIRITNSEIEIENVKFEWNDIYDFGLMVKPNRYMTFHELIVFSYSRGKKTYNLFSFQNQEDEIMKNLNYFKKKFESNKNKS